MTARAARIDAELAGSTRLLGIAPIACRYSEIRQANAAHLVAVLVDCRDKVWVVFSDTQGEGDLTDLRRQGTKPGTKPLFLVAENGGIPTVFR